MTPYEAAALTPEEVIAAAEAVGWEMSSPSPGVSAWRCGDEVSPTMFAAGLVPWMRHWLAGQ